MTLADPEESGGPTRRDFLKAGALAPIGLGFGGRNTGPSGPDLNCILLFLVGGPSHLDTWDMKPGAPSEVRGPFRPIATRVPSVHISEIFPRLAARMDRVSLVRTLHHDGPAVHDAGHQLLQTGRFFGRGPAGPHVGSVAARVFGPRGEAPAHVLLPGPIGPTGGNMPHGQDAGSLGRPYDPFVPGPDPGRGGCAWSRETLSLDSEPPGLRERYGPTPFGRDCLRARRLVERGVRFVTVNMYRTVFDATTWDAHGSAPFSTLGAYRDEVGPTFDLAYTALLDDLESRGLLGSTMVVAVGEFGRTPRLNPAGGRDHHPGCWTGLFAGGSIQGGRVVGRSDANGERPDDRPVSPAEVVATIGRGLGLDPGAGLPKAEPIEELS